MKPTIWHMPFPGGVKDNTNERGMRLKGGHMRIATTVYESHDAFFSPAIAIVDIDPRYARVILERIDRAAEMKKQDDSFLHMEYWTEDVLWLYASPEEIVDEDKFDHFNGGFPVVVSDEVDLSGYNTASVDIETMVIWNDTSVSWEACVKDTEVRLETRYVPREMIERATNG